MDLALAIAILVLLVGVVGSVVPGVPAPLVSLVGVLGYWWYTGFAQPGSGFVAVAGLLCLLALAGDVLASVVSARASGASLRTALLAGVVGVVLLFVFGPLGVLLGVGGTVFAVELCRTDDGELAARSALYTIVGMLASTVVQLAVTLGVLVGFVAATAV